MEINLNDPYISIESFCYWDVQIYGRCSILHLETSLFSTRGVGGGYRSLAKKFKKQYQHGSENYYCSDSLTQCNVSAGIFDIISLWCGSIALKMKIGFFIVFQFMLLHTGKRNKLYLDEIREVRRTHFPDDEINRESSRHTHYNIDNIVVSTIILTVL